MKANQVLGVVVVAGLAYGAGRLGLATESSASVQPGEAAAAGDDPTAPGEHHKVLEMFNGNWEGTFTIHTPGAGVMESKGTVKREWILDGRFMLEQVRADMGPEGEFVGYGVLGYNNAEERYETFWIDNLSTAMIRDNGTYNADTKQMSFRGKARNMAGQMVTTRGELDLSDPDRHVYRGYEIGSDGVERLAIEGVMEKSE